MEERKTGKLSVGTICISSGSGADQFTKWLAVTYLKDQDPLIIIPGVFQFRYLETVGLHLNPAVGIGRLYCS